MSSASSVRPLVSVYSSIIRFVFVVIRLASLFQSSDSHLGPHVPLPPARTSRLEPALLRTSLYLIEPVICCTSIVIRHLTSTVSLCAISYAFSSPPPSLHRGLHPCSDHYYGPTWVPILSATDNFSTVPMHNDPRTRDHYFYLTVSSCHCSALSIVLCLLFPLPSI